MASTIPCVLRLCSWIISEELYIYIYTCYVEIRLLDYRGNPKTRSRDRLFERSMAYLRLFITRSSSLKIEIATTRARAVPSGRAIKTQTYTIIVTHRHRVVRRSLALLHAYLSLALVDRSLQVIHVRRQTSDRIHGTLMIVLRRHRAARRCRRRRLSRDHKTGAHTVHRIARPNAPRTRNTN